MWRTGFYFWTFRKSTRPSAPSYHLMVHRPGGSFLSLHYQCSDWKPASQPGMNDSAETTPIVGINVGIAKQWKEPHQPGNDPMFEELVSQPDRTCGTTSSFPIPESLQFRCQQVDQCHDLVSADEWGVFLQRLLMHFMWDPGLTGIVYASQ